MAIIWLVIIGAAAGFIATQVMDEDVGLVQTIALGIAGALIGGIILRLILALTSMASGFVGAILGSIALIWLWRRYGPR